MIFLFVITLYLTIGLGILGLFYCAYRLYERVRLYYARSKSRIRLQASHYDRNLRRIG